MYRALCEGYVHQLVIKGFSIVDARCNHEVYVKPYLINNFNNADQCTVDFFKINVTYTRLITCFRLPQWLVTLKDFELPDDGFD